MTNILDEQIENFKEDIQEISEPAKVPWVSIQLFGWPILIIEIYIYISTIASITKLKKNVQRTNPSFKENAMKIMLVCRRLACHYPTYSFVAGVYIKQVNGYLSLFIGMS